MTDMVERACRAVCRRRGIPQDERQIGDDGEKTGPYWEVFEDDIRAALEAAFKVTDEDAKAALKWDKATVDRPLDGFGLTFAEAMQALSDAALKERP